MGFSPLKPALSDVGVSKRFGKVRTVLSSEGLVNVDEIALLVIPTGEQVSQVHVGSSAKPCSGNWIQHEVSGGTVKLLSGSHFVFWLPQTP